MDMNEQELKQLLEDVKTEFAKAVKAETEPSTLAKSEGADAKAKEAKTEETPKEGLEKKAKDEDEGKEDDKDKDKKKKKDKKDDKDDKEDKDDDDEGKPPFEKKYKKSEDPEVDYEKMTKSERSDHYRKLKPLIWKDEGFQAPSEPKAAKVEEKPVVLAKSEEIKDLEGKLEAKDSKIERLEKSMDEVTKAFDIMVNGPNRKSVASITEVKKPGEEEIGVKDLSPSQIKQKLGGLKPDSLSKTERDSINAYCMHGSNEEAILKLLEKN